MVVATAKAEIARLGQDAHARKARAHERTAAVVGAVDEEDLAVHARHRADRAADAGFEVAEVFVADDENANAHVGSSANAPPALH